MRRWWKLILVMALATTGVVARSGPAGAHAGGLNGKIAFARSNSTFDDSVVYMSNPDGSDLQRVLPAYNASAPHWSPDGTQLAVISGVGVPCPPTCTGNTVIINAGTGAVDRILPSVGYPAVSTFCSIWSPDGSHFLCEGGNDDDQSVNGVYTIRSSDGGDLTRITAPAAGDDLPIDYSPSGTQIVYGHTGPFDTCDRTSALFVVNADGSGKHRITPLGFCDDDGSWSPDGTRIAFVTSGDTNPDGRGSGSNGAIFTVRPDGSGLTRIPLPNIPGAFNSRAFAGDVSWSPDGSKLVFLVTVFPDRSSFREGIATADADGSNVSWVSTSPTFDNQPDWGTRPPT